MPDKKFEEYAKKIQEEEGIKHVSYWNMLERAFKAGRKAQRKDMVDEEIAHKELTELEWQAVEFMQINGHEVGNGDIVDQANEIAFDLAMKKKLENDGWFDIVDDLCRDCKGWDGRSNLCDCGSRIVYWDYTVEVCDFRDMQIFTTVA